MSKRSRQRIYEFEDFRLDAAHLLLYRQEQQILLAPKVIETLLALVERHGEVLSKVELMEIVWADSIVEESNLSQNLYLLRKILGKTTGGKPLIETLRRRGYRFNGDILCVEAKTTENSSLDKSQSAAPKISTDHQHFNVERQGDIQSLVDRKTNEQNEPENSDYQSQNSEHANAYQVCQLSRIYYHQLTPPDLIKSRALLEKAIQLDADYAPAYAALAEQFVTEAIVGLHAPAECFANAKDAIERASDLNGNSAEFYAAAGYVNLVCDWNFAEAGRNLQKSLELNSYCASANNYLGQVFMFQRRFDEAEIYLLRAREIEPTGLYNRSTLTIAYFLARKYQKVIEESENTLAVYPQFLVAAQIRCWALEQTGRAAEAVSDYEKILNEPRGEFALRWIGCAYALVGDKERARETAALLIAEHREHYVSPMHLAMLYAGLNEADEACSYLEKAAAERDPWMLWIAADPRFDNLRSERRFQKLEKFVMPTTRQRHVENDNQINEFSALAGWQNESDKDFARKTKNDLSVVSSAAPAGRENKSTVESKTNKTTWLLAAICGLFLLFAVFFLQYKWRTDSRFEKIELKALTTSGNIVESAIAPDGKMLAYVKSERGKQSLWIRQIQLRTSEMRLTEPNADNIFKGLTFTADGSKIYFLLKPKNNSINQLYAVPILGGQPQFILDDVDSPPSFAPDGERFAFMRRNTKLGVTALMVSDADGSDARELTESKSPLDYRLRPLAWSPDGKIIARVFLDQTKPSDFSVVGFDMESKTEKKLSEQIWNEIEAIGWTKNGAGLILTASELKSPLGSQLWFLSYPSGTAQKLTNDLSNYVNPSVARATGEMVARQTQIENQVWLVNFKSAAAPRRVSPNNADGEHGLLWTPDGNLIYSSEINGTNSLQRMSVRDFSPTALTTNDKYVFRMPCATPDGRYLVYTSTQENQFRLWRVDADGKNPKQLTAANVENPNCSPDSRWIFYGAVANGRSSLWKVSIDGGEPQRVTEKISFHPQISPDGTRIACFYRADAKAAWQIAILSTGEDRALQTFDLPKTVALSSSFVWTKEGDGLILIDTREGIANLWTYPLDGQMPTQLTDFNDDSLPFINNFAISTDDSQLALTRGRKISDVVEITDVNSTIH